MGNSPFPIPHSPLADLEETPEYLQGVAGLPDELAALAEEGDQRPLTRSERARLRAGIDAAAARVRQAKEDRDGVLFLRLMREFKCKKRRRQEAA